MEIRMAHLEGAYEQISFRLTAIEQRLERGFAAMDQRFGAIDQRFGTTDQRFGSLDQRFGSLDQRFGTIDQRFDAVDRRIGAIESKIDKHFLWVVGLLLVSILLPLVGRLGAH